jgi:hypothetical protein
MHRARPGIVADEQLPRAKELQIPARRSTPTNTFAHSKRTTGAGMLLNGRACDQIFFAEFGFDPAGWEVLFCTKSAMTAYVEQRVPIRAVAR